MIAGLLSSTNCTPKHLEVDEREVPEPEVHADPPGGLMPLPPHGLVRYRKFGGPCGESLQLLFHEAGTIERIEVEGCRIGDPKKNEEPPDDRLHELGADDKRTLRRLLRADALQFAPEWVELPIPEGTSRITEMQLRTPYGLRVRRFASLAAPVGFADVAAFIETLQR